MSDKRGATLQSLRPAAVAPVNASGRRPALQELKKISAIRVAYGGKDSKNYVVEVFADPTRSALFSTDSTQSDSSTVFPAQDDETVQVSTVRIERALHDFTRLRDKVYNVVHTAHYSQHCEFCTALLHWSVLSTNPDGLFLPLLGGKNVAKKLTTFLTSLVACIAQDVENAESCKGRALAPHIVYTFLFTSSSASDAA